VSRDAVSAASSCLPSGFFGKLPSRGDFVTRRLPQEFVARWDGWLREALAASRAELDADWLEIYLTSPVWRFALAPGVCGAHGCIGAMIPSVDKVGRYFPLAAVSPLEPGASPLAIAMHADDWFADIEELLLATLAETPLALEAFDDRLAGLVPNVNLNVKVNGAATAWPGFAAPGADAWHFGVRCGALADALAVLGSNALVDAGWRSVWWSQGSERIEPCVLVAPELPEPRAFAAMLDGGWAERGWSRGALPERGVEHAKPAVRSAGISDTGKLREVNEDAWACRDDLGVFIVADGLGGHQAGELASRMVVAALEAVDGAAAGDARVEQLVRGFNVTNRCLRVLADRAADVRLAASTVVALVVDDRTATCLWAGDSRIYRARNGRLAQLTADHSEVARGAVESRAVTRAVGGADALEVGRLHVDARDGDRFLLCTDGLYAEVDEAAIVDALSMRRPEQGCAKLRDAALDGDARDNLTAVIVHVGETA
jgi:type VI secretion system protein ImpM